MSAEIIDVDFRTRVSKVRGKPEVDQKLYPPTKVLTQFEAFSQMIAEGKTLVIFDGTFDGVLVPDHLKILPRVDLNWSLRFGLQDFEFDERGVRGTLSFNREPFYCDIPWAAVYAMENLNSKLQRRTWPERIPKVFFRTYETRVREAPPSPPTKEAEHGKQSKRLARKNSPRMDKAGAGQDFLFKLGQKIGKILGGRD